MKKIPSLISLLALLAAVLLFWAGPSFEPVNPQVAEQIESDRPTPLPATTSSNDQSTEQAAAQSSFKPSERIRADSVVAFPADI